MRGRPHIAKSSGIFYYNAHNRATAQKECSPCANEKHMSEKHKIDSNTLDALLYLSRLSPESTNMDVLKAQVDQIVEYFDILSVYDDNENPYDAYPATVADCLRADTPVAGLPMRDIKNITAEFMDGYFRVPKVLGGGA